MSDTTDNNENTQCACGSGLQSMQCCGVEGRTALNVDVYAYVSSSGTTSDQKITREISHAIETVTENPLLFPARVNLMNNKAWFVKMSPETYRDSVFLDPVRIKGTCVVETDIAWLGDVCSNLKWYSTPFIFHSAFCGSTLMSQVLERAFHCQSLREPELLGNILHYQNAEVTEDKKTLWLENLLKLISRRFLAEDPIIVKANDYANPLMPVLLSWRQDIPILFMYTPLSEFIAGCLKAENRKEWIKQRFESIKLQLPSTFPHIAESVIDESSYGEMAAVYWSYNLAMYLKASSLNSSLVKSLNFNDMLDRPIDTIKAAGNLFKLNAKKDVDLNVIVEKAFGVYSKNSNFRYSPAQRRQELQRQIAQFKKEQDSGQKTARLLLQDNYPDDRLRNDLLHSG